MESESITDEVWKLLMDDKQVRIIGICGEGGVGKTTLLKQIYDKLSNSPHDFDFVIWVTVSSNSTFGRLQDNIWRRIGVINGEWVEKDTSKKAEAIHDVLREKKFVLFLDDIWKSMDLTRLGVPIAEENESKILLTSRSEFECSKQGARRIIRVEALEQEPAWELFKNKLGEDKLSDPKIHHLASLMAQQCGGLPLLLCTVARAMIHKSSNDEWEDALKQATAETKSRMPHLLKFCYDALANDRIRYCFLFFSLFPEDFTILKNDLIDFWICEQLLDDDTEKDTLKLGYNTVDALIGACFLDEEDNNYVKLQDLIRDFGFSTAIHFYVFRRPKGILPHTSRRFQIRGTVGWNLKGVGWYTLVKQTLEFRLTSVAPNLLTFLGNHNPSIMVDLDAEDTLSHLTVLDLSNSGLEVVPLLILELKGLQYLNLSHTWIEYLPVELNKFACLKCLNLEHNEQLRVIPKQLIYGLPSLQILKMFRCGFSVEEKEDNILSVNNMDIDSVLCLNNLKVLSITITCVAALQKFFSNPKLLTSTQSLSLEVFWGSKSLDISPLLGMKNLLKLEIHHAESLKDIMMGHGGLNHSDLLKERCLERLGEVKVENCSSLCDLTWMILAPNLKILRVKSCEEMEEIISTRRLGEILNGGENWKPFEKLEMLGLESLPKLKSIYWKPLPLRCLKRIKVIDCTKLKKLPLNCDSRNKEDVVIGGDEDWWNNVEWEDDAARATLQPCFKPVLD